MDTPFDYEDALKTVGLTADDVYEVIDTVRKMQKEDEKNNRYDERGFDKYTGEYEGGATISGPVAASQKCKGDFRKYFKYYPNDDCKKAVEEMATNRT